MRTQSGFTLIELLMVILLVGILAAVSLPQFVDFSSDAKNAAARSALANLRTAIGTQTANMKLRCNSASGAYPTVAQLNANDITTGGAPCTTALVVASDRKFISGSVLPDNPWSGGATKNTVIACTGAATGCSQTDNTACDGNAYAAASSGWCYNVATGEVWANSALNGATVKEYTY